MSNENKTLLNSNPLLQGRGHLIALIVICSVIELALQIADLGGWGGARLRAQAYEYGAFWAGLLGRWQPNYPLQPYTMFVSYAFLHGGLVHLVVNMITLWSLGGEALNRVGVRGFWLLYVASAVGGAGFYALFATATVPMVGASGALFGLAGGILAWNYIDRFVEQRRLWPVARAGLLLVVLNVVMWWAMNGQLAWQTHLGGFLIGWVAAMIIDPRSEDQIKQSAQQGGTGGH